MQVQELYNDPVIIVLSYPYEIQTVGNLNTVNAGLYVQYMAYLNTAVNTRQLDQVHVLQLQAQRLDLTNWCNAHPNAAAHAVFAAQIVAYMESLSIDWDDG